MSDLRLDPTTGDLALENGDFVLLSSDPGADTRLEWFAQSLRSHLRTFLGEWFLQLDEGVPYYQEILRKNPNPRVIEAILKQRIVTFPGVLEIMNLELDYDNVTRTLRVQNLEVRTTEGSLTFPVVELGA